MHHLRSKYKYLVKSQTPHTKTDHQKINTVSKKTKLLLKIRNILPIFFKPTTTVSRELIIIPKVRYESLIKNEQLKETKSIQDEEVQNRNRRQKNIHTSQRENLENDLIEQEGDVKINETEKQRSDPIMDNIQIEKRIKVNRRKSGIQKGSGKSYVKMSPLQFSNKNLSFPL